MRKTDMYIYTISKVLLSVTIVGLCDCAFSTYKFDVSQVHVTGYGEILGAATARGMIHCTVYCAQSDACKSVIFTSVDSMCTMNRYAVVIPDILMCTGSSCGAPVKYAPKPNETAPAVIQKACLQTSNCIGANAECRDNVCQCSAGYDYSYVEHTCILDPTTTTSTTTTTTSTTTTTTPTTTTTTTTTPTTTTTTTTPSPPPACSGESCDDD